jgi:hypothetical protein
MADDVPKNDPKAIWQNQSIEASTMTIEKIRQKARELHRKTRRQLLGTLSAPLAVICFYVFARKLFVPLQNVLQPLFACAFAWSLAGLYFLNRGKWSGMMPGDAGLSAGLEFCRREIERRRDHFRFVMLWGAGPTLMAIGTFILALAMVAGRGVIPKAMPFMILVVAWIASYLLILRAEQRKLQHELDELNEIARESSR